MPDFDIDFCQRRRKEVIDYVIEKYGSDRVAQIISFDTMAAKAALRDVGRALALSYAAFDSTVKLIPNELNITIDRAMSISSELKRKYENDAQTKTLIDIAKSIEGNAAPCNNSCGRRCNYGQTGLRLCSAFQKR